MMADHYFVPLHLNLPAVADDKVKRIPKATSLITRLANTYFDFLLNSLPRLIVLLPTLEAEVRRHTSGPVGLHMNVYAFTLNV